MKLPELPPTSWVDVPHFTYHAEAMRAYGEACAKAALEAAAAYIDDATLRLYGADFAEAIRSINVSK